MDSPSFVPSLSSVHFCACPSRSCCRQYALVVLGRGKLPSNEPFWGAPKCSFGCFSVSLSGRLKHSQSFSISDSSCCLSIILSSAKERWKRYFTGKKIAFSRGEKGRILRSCKRGKGKKRKGLCAPFPQPLLKGRRGLFLLSPLLFLVLIRPRPLPSMMKREAFLCSSSIPLRPLGPGGPGRPSTKDL